MRETYNIAGLRQLPVDFIGFNFDEQSARFLEAKDKELSHLKETIRRFENKHEFIKKIGVFVDAEMEFVLEKVKEYKLDYVQLHGNENVFYCEKLKKEGLKIIKSFSVDKTFSFTNTEAFQYNCDYFLFDFKEGQLDSNGASIDYSILNNYKGETLFFLGGNINPKMEKMIKSINHPKLYGLDLNSGLEIEPAFKDIDLIATFINNIQSQITI